MKVRNKQNFFIYYLLENNSNKFLYSIRVCKYPERTKEYKKLQHWLYTGQIRAAGWCDKGYFEDYKPNFIASNLTYLQNN